MKWLKYIDWQYVLGLLILPLAVAGALLLVGTIQGFTRFDPAYFTDEYLARYDVPGAVAIDLEQALRTGDKSLMAELRATKGGATDLESRPDLIFAVLASADAKYFNYIYFDASNYERVVQHVRKVNGRYVAAEEDLYYYVDSGRWQTIMAPLAIAWWIVVVVFTGGIWLYRAMAAARQRMYG